MERSKIFFVGILGVQQVFCSVAITPTDAQEGIRWELSLDPQGGIESPFEHLRNNRFWGDDNPYLPVVSEDPLRDYSQDVLVLFLPKSGNHLIYAILEEIGRCKSSILSKEEKDHLMLEFQGHRKIYFSQIGSKAHLDLLKTNVQKVLMIRDPRDVVVLQMQWMHASLGKEDLWKDLSMQELLTQLIQSNVSSSLKAQVEELVQLKKTGQFSVFKFEDMIGEKGGGSDKRQQEAILGLAKLLKYPLSLEQVKIIGNEIFDLSGSLRREQIGIFEAYFDRKNKMIFEQVFLNALKELGY